MPRVHPAIRHLRTCDPVMAEIVSTVGPLDLTPVSHEPFERLSRIIVGQQLSVAAAATIWQRVRASKRSWTPRSVCKLSEDALRACGLSRAKARAIQALAESALMGALDDLNQLSDSELLERITTLHGFGPWSAQMYLMFGANRMDVFAPADAGLRRAIMRAYKLDRAAYDERAEQISAAWSPWRTVACRYLWRWLAVVPDI